MYKIEITILDLSNNQQMTYQDTLHSVTDVLGYIDYYKEQDVRILNFKVEMIKNENIY